MKLLLGVESLEPRALLAGLCDIPTTGLQTPMVLLTEPAAEVGPMRGGVGDSLQASLGPSIDTEVAPPQGPHPDSTPIVNQPENQPDEPGDMNSEQTQPPTLQNPPSEMDKPGSTVESETPDLNPWEESEFKSDNGNTAPAASLSPSCSANLPLAPKTATIQAPFAESSARSGSATSPSFVSLFATTAPASSTRQFALSPSEREQGTKDTSDFHYFEPIGTDRLDGDNLESEPLANTAVRETFVAFWLMTKQDLEELQGPHAVTDTADATIPEASSEPVAVHQQGEVADSHQMDIVHKALAAISIADDVLREAEDAGAVAVNGTVEPKSIAQTAIAQALACSAAKSNQLSSRQAGESQPANPRWQLGMCSLVSILFSFRSPTKSSDKSWKPQRGLSTLAGKVQSR